MRVGIDLEQFVVDPQSSGIQRVLQQLARTWPTDVLDAEFVVPSVDGSRRCSALLTPEQADTLVSMAFEADAESVDLHECVRNRADSVDAPRASELELMARYDTWLLPEVSYLPTVLERTARFRSSMPTTMIAYDVLPMIDPGNYRFVAGASAQVSEYFRLLADADALVSISEWTRSGIFDELRRDPTLSLVVASPGGDHIPPSTPRTTIMHRPPRYLRVGTLEERKQPLAVLEAFRAARAAGQPGELIFIGRPSASHAHINQIVREAADEPDSGITWIDSASDDEVHRQIADADVFLSFGVEGFGIPVLEALRLGTPVLYSGIQPAAELMDGAGAMRVDSVADAFQQPSEALSNLQSSIDQDAVPKWSDFARSVAETIRRTLL